MTQETSLSPAEQITMNLFEVMVPRIFLQAADAAAFYGTMAQDSPNAQKEQEQGDMRVNLPATKMATLYAKGCKPWFIRPAESLRLYNSLKDYLKQASENFNQNTTSNRFDDKMMDNLLTLENFAEWVYHVALPYFPKDQNEPKGTLSGFRRNRPMGRLSRDQLEEVKQAGPVVPEHVRVVDEMIERKVARSRSGWS